MKDPAAAGSFHLQAAVIASSSFSTDRSVVGLSLALTVGRYVWYTKHPALFELAHDIIIRQVVDRRTSLDRRIHRGKLSTGRPALIVFMGGKGPHQRREDGFQPRQNTGDNARPRHARPWG